MDLKKEINSILKYIIASNMLLYFLNEPQHMAHFKKVFDDSKAKKMGDKAIAKLSSSSGAPIAYLIHPAIDFCRNNPEFNLDYMRRTLMININWIFEHLPNNKQYSYDNDPKKYSKEFEFFRHVRNACSHGNKFNVNRSKRLWDNPQYKAEWNGIKIDLSLDGKECFFSFLTLGDAMQLLEFVRDNI